VTVSWFFEMKSALDRVRDDAQEIIVPLLTLQAGADRIVEPSAAAPWVACTGSTDRTFRLLDGHYHELLNEPDWHGTLDQILTWLEVRMPRTLVPADGPP
jgi:alpha-beta hydrolase superfamily lysophospholipase